MNIVMQSEALKSHLYPGQEIKLDDLCYVDVKANNKYFAQWKCLREKLLQNWTTKNENLMKFKAFAIQ